MTENKSTWQKTRQLLLVIAKTPRVFQLVWNAQPGLVFGLVTAHAIIGFVPLATVWIMKILVDTIAAFVERGGAAGLAPITWQTLSDPSQLASSVPAPVITALSLMAFCWLAKGVLTPFTMYSRQQLNDYLTRNINLLIIDKVNSVVDIAVLENPKFYDHLQSLQDDLMYKPIQMIQFTSEWGQGVITLVTLSCVLGSLNPWLMAFIYCSAIPRFAFELKHAYEQWAVVEGTVPEVRRMKYFSTVLTNNRDGKEVRLFGLGGFFRTLYLDTFNQFHQRRAKLRRSHMLVNCLLAAGSALSVIATYAYTAIEALVGHISVGLMSMNVGALAQIEDHIANMVWLTIELYQQTLFLNRLQEFLDITPAIMPLPPGSGRPIPVPLKMGIEFCDVKFKYPDSDLQILDGVSFKIKPGQTVALVGDNGAGKSTIVKLLARLYDPSEGKILVDGVDLKEYDPTQWRLQMSVVFQDYCRFHMTMGENIGIGDVDRISDLGLVQAAAQRGGAVGIAEKLCSGYDTMLGKMFEASEVGIELSGGEWQKIALARSFMRSVPGASGAQLLILDEPTASLDVQSEHDVYCRFRELIEGKMGLLITHRFSTVRIADLILVLQNGKIIEAGGHDQLMAADTAYARLFNLQADRYR